uniref:Uncharacterized protein n=1 Tax=Romanomermis culicivorax TaxID=13658 RepID=A0A915IBV1_ROMCU
MLNLRTKVKISLFRSFPTTSTKDAYARGTMVNENRNRYQTHILVQLSMIDRELHAISLAKETLLNIVQNCFRNSLNFLLESSCR